MRRRRDERDAGREKRSRAIIGVDLVAGQLAALARLGALGDLDLQHVGVDQVVRRHAETSRRHLLDLGVLPLGAVTGRDPRRPRRSWSARPAVHGNGQRLVGFRRERAEGHAGGVEAREHLLLRLHLVDGESAARSSLNGASRSRSGRGRCR